MILIDMNLSPSWVEAFSEKGIESIHWSSIGKANAPDSEIMAYARNHDLIVFTHDLDFGAILFHTKAKAPSVIQIRGEEIRPDQIIGLVVRAVASSMEELKSGALLTIDAQRHRLVILPLGA